MLIVISIIVILIGLVFLLSAIIMASNVKRARTPRSRRMLIRRCRNTFILTLLVLGGGITMLVFGLRPLGREKAIHGDLGYKIDTTYVTTLAASGEEKAYPYLPQSVYAYDGKLAFRNGRNEWFVYEETENSEGEKNFTWINRGKQTTRYQTVSLDKEIKLTAQLSQTGDLYVEGTFPYMTYDTHSTQYSDILDKGVKDFFCSDNALFYLNEENTLFAFGFNEYGQLGDGSNRHKSEPVEIQKDIVAVSSSKTHTLMVDIFGNLYSVGDNSDSELGDGTMGNSSKPIRVMSGVKSVAAGNFFSVILAQNGEVYTCGRTNVGQCGNGSKNGTARPNKIGEGAIKIVAGDTGAAYLTEDGKVYAWGQNTEHCFVKDDTEFFNTPTLVAEDVYDIALEEGSFVLLTRDRTIKVSGKLSNKKRLFQVILDIGAKVPEEYVSPVKEEEKPDASELGKE